MKANRLDQLHDALRLVLLFHQGGVWTADAQAEWSRIAGTPEATSKVLCDHVRAVLFEEKR